MLQASLSTQISQGELARTVTYRKIDGQGNQDLIEAHVWIDFLTLLCVCTGYFGGTSATHAEEIEETEGPGRREAMEGGVQGDGAFHMLRLFLKQREGGVQGDGAFHMLRWLMKQRKGVCKAMVRSI